VQNWKKRFWIHLYSVTFVVAFVGYLTTLSVAQTIQRWRKDNEWMMNWKECGRKRSWPNFRHYRGICLDKLRKTTNKCQDNRSPRRDLNRGPLKYEAGLLTTRPRRSVCTPSWNSYTLSLCFPATLLDAAALLCVTVYSDDFLTCKKLSGHVCTPFLSDWHSVNAVLLTWNKYLCSSRTCDILPWYI
jgi:hypothetical protein